MDRPQRWAVDGTAFDRWLDWLYWGPDRPNPECAGDRAPRRPLPRAGAGAISLEADDN